MKFRPILYTAIFLLITSCAKEPAERSLESYSFYFSGVSDNRLFPGEIMNTTFTGYINATQDTGMKSFKITFEPVSGGGAVNPDAVTARSSAPVNVSWTLGSETFCQRLRARAYDKTGHFLTSTDLTAYAMIDNSWNEVTWSPASSIQSMATDTVNGVTMITSGSRLYKRLERYYEWQAVTSTLFESPHTPVNVEVDHNGVFFVSTWYGDINRSLDHGSTWIGCVKPFSGYSGYLKMYLSNDNRLWAYVSSSYPVRYSDDQGATWKDAGSALSLKGDIGDVFRLKNHALLYHSTNCCSLYISYDDGSTWTQIPTPGYSNKLFVNENDEIYICTQLQGISIYRSTDYGTSFQFVKSVAPQFGTSMDNVFNKWKGYYYIMIPGYGILKSANLISYEDYWVNTRVCNLFIDHEGTLIARDQNYNTVYCRHNSE